MNYLRSIKYGIENLIYWFKIIWTDRNWDSYYIFEILRHKLIKMEEIFREEGMHVDANKDADKMKVCILLLNRIINDNYWELAGGEKHWEKWGTPQFSSEPIDDEFSRLIVTHKNCKTEEDEKQMNKEFRGICKHEYKLSKQDIKYLFHLMAKHILTWWD